MKIDFNEIRIKVKITDGKVKAIICVDFGDFIVKGFRIQESQYDNSRGQKLWLTPPAYLGGGRYHPIFFAPDKSVWDKLESLIWETYETAKNDHYKKVYDLKDGELDQIL